LKPSFNLVTDVFPADRHKLIHSVGTIAKAKWTILNANVSAKYTGIIGNGCENLLVRLSVAKEPNVKKTTAEEALNNFIPGMSLKCLRNGKPSANLQAMFSVGGQPSWNFFENNFSNLIPFPDLETVNESGKLLAGKFTTVSPFVGNVGLKDLAAVDEKGVEVMAANYPFQLIFKPAEVTQKKVFSKKIIQGQAILINYQDLMLEIFMMFTQEKSLIAQKKKLALSL